MDWSMMALWATRIVTFGTGLMGVGLGLLYYFQEKLIYLPRIPGVPDDFPYLPDKFYLDYEENAGNMAFRLHFLNKLARQLDCSVFAPSYRGYGLSAGTPTEAGLKLDAQAALDHLRGMHQIDSRKVSVFGRSLGGAVAIHLAATNKDKIHAVMIENTFTSIEDVAGQMMPVLKPFVGRGRWFNFLVRNKWDNRSEIRQLADKPLLLISSQFDELLPSYQMTELHEVVGGKSAKLCTWLPLPAGHMDAYQACPRDYWPAMRTFADSHADWSAESGAANEDGEAGGPMSAPSLRDWASTWRDAAPDAQQNGVDGGQSQETGVAGGTAPGLMQEEHGGLVFKAGPVIGVVGDAAAAKKVL